MEKRPESGELRMLNSVKPGDELPEVEVSATVAQQQARMDAIAEPLETLYQ